jgi:cytochrome c biogenesis protein CcdA
LEKISGMNENKLMQQVATIFGTFMTLFYFGVGFYLILSPNLTYVDKFLRILVGSTFIFYGLYRAYRTYVKIKEVFFTPDDEE